MYISNVFLRVAVFTVLSIFFCHFRPAQAQQPVPAFEPSDPVAVAIMQGWLNSFGEDVYHCKWEFDAERARQPYFENGKSKVHIEGEWSFSAKLGSSYTFRYEGVEYIIREVEGSQGRVLSFWPEANRNGQKFAMKLLTSYNSHFRGDLGSMRGGFYPCVLRTKVLEDSVGNPSVFGIHSLARDQAVIAIDTRRKDFIELQTLKTNDGIQPVSKSWKVSEADPDHYRMYSGAEYDSVYSNVRVNNAWLPAEVRFTQRTEAESSGVKSVFETSRWRIVGDYKVNRDVSRFKKIDPPAGTLFYDELTYTTQRIGGGVGTWETLGNNELEFGKLDGATSVFYSIGRSRIFRAVVVAFLVIGFIFIVIKTNRLGLRKKVPR